MVPWSWLVVRKWEDLVPALTPKHLSLEEKQEMAKSGFEQAEELKGVNDLLKYMSQLLMVLLKSRQSLLLTKRTSTIGDWSDEFSTV